MHDADFATTLLNGWKRTSEREDDGSSAIDLLREGGLEFKYFRGRCLEASDQTGDDFEIECITFHDGSRALRLAEHGSVLEFAKWVAVAPSPRGAKSSPTCLAIRDQHGQVN